jgi:hypothetical protein
MIEFAELAATAPASNRRSAMKFPTWTKPAINGAIFGAIATMAYGFTQGGWYSAGSAEAMAHQRSEVAVIEA